MSRPAGLPPKPVVDANHRNSEYRPLPPPRHQFFDQNRDAHGQNNNTFQFKGNGNPDNRENRAPGTGSSRSNGDSYRPPSSDFTFRQAAPHTLDLSRTGDSYRPSEHGRRDRDRDRRGPHGRDRRGGRGRANDRSRPSRKAAERPFLQTNRAPTPELMPGMEEEEEHAPKYMPLEDLSDSDETDMDLSDSENEASGDSAEQPKKKQVKTETGAADGNSVPKWSNPDPYFVLPPVDESTHKKKDVVKLIRKARVQDAMNALPKPGADADDFISFDFGDEDEAEESEKESEADGPADRIHDQSNGFSHRDEIVGPRPPKQDLDVATPPAKARAMEPNTDSDLGNRKRTYDDKIKGPSMVPKPVPRGASSGKITSEWRAKDGIDPTPWLLDHSETANLGAWLHKEIIDFYDCFKPSETEERMRNMLIDDLRHAVQGFWRDADVLPFGSFPAGLYLPTADMDLVVVSRDYMSGGYGRYTAKSSLFRLRSMLVDKRIAAYNSVEVISKAKVPLVKYIDQYTGLRIDVSFENDTGLIANKTFQEWKRQYPAMPILVTIIKQYLAMRGLNEPVNGGIGGFTVTCLVVSLLQMMPQIQSGSMTPEHHLGEILMEFFDLYGNQFNVQTTAIRLNPPGYVRKSHARTIVYKNMDRFSIIDPNSETNDISGGSSNTATIRKAFSKAFDDLQERMQELATKPIAERRNQSILGCILGGDYSTFEIQRNHLFKIWDQNHSRRYDRDRY